METGRDDFVIAIRSAFLRKGTQQRFSLLSLILFSIVFLILGFFNFKVINLSRAIVNEIIYTTSFIVTIPENVIKDSFNKTSNHFNYYEDYQLKKSELEKLKQKDLSKKIITFENIELKKLIDDYFAEDSQTYAKVLLDRKSPFLRSIAINKGSKNDVKIGMSVYDDIYLIGKIVEVNFLTSRVLLISDINSKVPVTIQPNNIQAIMSGSGRQKGTLQYINKEIVKDDYKGELIVVTSGTGGFFKSGIPIGKINQIKILNNNEWEVNFYTNFSQLKYVKILSYSKEKINFDKIRKDNFEIKNNQILTMNSQIEDIRVLKQQKTIGEEIRNQLEIENNKLKIKIIDIQKKLTEQTEQIKNIKTKNENKNSSELNLLYKKKCKKSFFKPKLFVVGTDEYKECILLKKGQIEKVR